MWKELDISILSEKSGTWQLLTSVLCRYTFSQRLRVRISTRGHLVMGVRVDTFIIRCSLLPFCEIKQGILDLVAAWFDRLAVDDGSLVLVEVC